jgi:hypothetical protein
MLAPDLWSAIESYDIAYTKADNKIEKENATKRVIQTIGSVYSPDAAFGSEIQKAKRDYYSFYTEELEEISNNLIALSENWKERQVSILHQISISKQTRSDPFSPARTDPFSP